MSKLPESGRISAAFHRYACEYDQHVLVQKRVVAQLAQSIELHLNRNPENILDIGTGTGALLERLHARYSSARLTGVDIALNMCQHTQQKLGSVCQVVNCDAVQLPFKADVFDLVVSASALQWVEDLPAALCEMHRVVRVGGTVCLAFFCEGTLAEMQECFHNVADQRCMASNLRVPSLHEFRSVDEVKDIVNNMDFEQIVMTVETETDWYDDLYALLRSIKNIGAGTVSNGNFAGLGWRGILQEASKTYQERYGYTCKIPATYKVLYLFARSRS
ncbi:MAG: methyltransferase domain-containing protein [Desulfuromonadaceae bacterium]|nr:methyltransferase domain-containing protein [Desulfuromonadaceae bacterium]MDD5107130.1 methyltransferase domain-containing protein [Desulfuromonadaceae bacterium]